MEIKTNDDRYIAHTYQRYPLTIDHGNGAVVYDEQGKAYLDFTAGIGVNIFGYHDEAWIKAVSEQMEKCVHTSNLYTNACNVETAMLLCQKSGCKKVFFANSGAESNEGAIKAARKYSHDRYGAQRYEIITLTNSFHGRTITTLSACGQEVFHHHFMPFTPGFVYVKANDITDLYEKVSDHTCAIMIEVIQGEGGVIPLTKAFTQAVQKICAEQDILLIIDEVQTGIGRCGSLFAYEQYDLHPDIVTCAKGLGGGLPIGAVLLYDKVEDVFHYGDHGTTFGGNPLACAGAKVILNRLDDELYEKVKAKGNYLKAQLQTLPHVEAIMGMGLMIGVRFDKCKGKDVATAALAKGALMLSAKDHLRLLPPLIISQAQIDEGIRILNDVLSQEW